MKSAICVELPKNKSFMYTLTVVYNSHNARQYTKCAMCSFTNKKRERENRKS